MVNEVSSGGGGSGDRPDGDPTAISQHAEWARSLANAISEAGCLIGEAYGLSAAGWQTLSAERFREWMDDLSTGCRWLTNAANEAADQLSAYSNALALGQGTMDQVRTYVSENNVQVEDGCVQPPNELWKTEPDAGPGVTGIDLAREQEVHYDYIRSQVELAQSYITESKDSLTQVAETCGNLARNVTSGIVSSEQLGLEFRDRFFGEPAERLRTGSDNLRRWAIASRQEGLGEIAEEFDEVSEAYAKKAGLKLASAADIGLVAKAMGKVGGPFSTIYGITLDVASGESVEKATVKGAGGVAVGSGASAVAVAATVAFASNPAGWVVGSIGALAGAGGALGGSGLTGWLYDKVAELPIPIDERWCLVED